MSLCYGIVTLRYRFKFISVTIFRYICSLAVILLWGSGPTWIIRSTYIFILIRYTLIPHPISVKLPCLDWAIYDRGILDLHGSYNLFTNIMITTKDSAQRREVGSSRNLSTSLSSTAHRQDWSSINSIVTPAGEASGQLSGISTGKHVAGSWWSVQTPACYDVRDRASVGRV